MNLVNIAYRQARRAVRWLRNFFVQQVVQCGYAPMVKDIPYQYVPGAVKKVWIVWWQGRNQMPPLIENCYRSVVKHNPDKEVVVIDKENFSRYVTLPDHILRKLDEGKITLTHMSDILRFALLEQQGGWYLDATLFLFGPLPDKEDLYTGKHSQKFYDFHSGVWTGFFWFMPKGHPVAAFMNKCLWDYWKKNDKLIAYFLVDHLLRLYYDKQPAFRSYINALPLNNRDMYFFRGPAAYEPYDRERWEAVVKETTVFKFNRKIRPIPSRGEIPDGTFLAWLVDDCFEVKV